MPSLMNFQLPIEWIPSELYEKALKYIEKRRTHIHAENITKEKLLMYFVSTSQLCAKKDRLKVVNAGAVRQFERTLAGEKPINCNWNDFEKISMIGLSLAKVYVSNDAAAEVLECAGNPLNLMCLGCIGYHQRGICAHVLAATHMHFRGLNVPNEQKPKQHNVRYMCAKLYGDSASRPNHRPSKAPGALQVDREVIVGADQINEARNVW